MISPRHVELPPWYGQRSFKVWNSFPLKQTPHFIGKENESVAIQYLLS